MGSKDHVAVTIGDAVIMLGRVVVEELFDAGVGDLCVSSLLGDYFAEGVHEFVINRANIVEDGANDALDAFDFGVV